MVGKESGSRFVAFTGHPLPGHQHHVGPADPRRRGRLRRQLRARRRDRQAEAGRHHRHRRCPGPAADARASSSRPGGAPAPAPPRASRVALRAAKPRSTASARTARSWSRPADDGSVAGHRRRRARTPSRAALAASPPCGPSASTATPPTPVPGLWLDLVPPGSTLDAVPGRRRGRPVDTGVSGLDTVGTPGQGRRAALRAEQEGPAPAHRLRLHRLPLRGPRCRAPRA